jgi:hypothetical protein
MGDLKAELNAHAQLLGQIRLIVLLDSSERAGLAPVPVLHLHMLAYWADVLAPVWNIAAFDGKVLKRQGGPFYPRLQHDLDRLVGLGVVKIEGLSHIRDEENRWRIEGKFSLNKTFAEPIVKAIATAYSTNNLMVFIRELAYAASGLSNVDFERSFAQDATYSDPVIDPGNVVDFGEWQRINYSAAAARAFLGLIPGGSKATPGEMLHLYVRHLQSRIHGVR